MYRNKSKGLSVLRRFGIAALSGVMVLSLGLAAACSEDDEDSETTTTSEDTQTIANGNFEYFDTGDDDAHIIYTPDSWSSSSSGNSNYVMNGVIDTSAEGWATISDPELGYTLAYNNTLDEDDDDYDDEYVDYNDMSAVDIPYSNARSALTDESYFTIFEEDDGSYYIYTNEYEAVIEEDEDEVDSLLDGDTKQYVTANGDGTYYYTDSDGETITVNEKTLIDNPLTHNVITDNNDGTATYTDENGEEVTLYVDDDGNYYYDEDMTESYESHVLMIHNFVNNSSNSNLNSYGNEQSYSSSTTIELDPNTAAVFSVWVKTTELTYGRNGADAAQMNGGDDLGNLGAYISVDQTVSGTSIGSFSIEGINTAGVTENNGWVQYTVYLRACDFASTTFTITLGLGIADDDDYTYAVAGYAFFDDLECTIYPTINESVNQTVDLSETSYSTVTDYISYVMEDTTSSLYYTLDDLVDDDVACNTYTWCSEDIDTVPEDKWYDYNTFYINLSAYDITKDNSKNYVSLLSNVLVQLTEDDDYYVTSKEFSGTSSGVDVSSPIIFDKTNSSQTEYSYVNEKLNIDTSSDVIAAFTIYDLINNLDSYDLGDDYAETIQSLFVEYDEDGKTVFNFVGDIPDADEDTTALVLLSARGAAYTATIEDDNAFLLNSSEYMVVSFWVKTSDMDDFTAATVNIVYKDSNGDIVSTSTITLDTTDVQFDAGDYEDIYNGWVQCFFYVENPTDLDDLTFYLEFCFGNTTIKDTSLSDYKSGYVAIANITTFVVSEDVFNLTSTGDYAASFSFEETDNRENNYMDTVYSSKSDEIEENITTPASYYGVYGGSANTVYRETTDESGYGARNSNAYAGLINQDYFGNYIDAYNDAVTANDEDTQSSYYWLTQLIENYTDYTISSITEAAKVWEELFGYTCVQPLLIVNTIQYFESSGVYAMNYGFKAASATTVSSSSYEAITVRVYVSAGAVAYVYLTEEDDITEVSSFSLPTYSFWYDTVGNVLDSEPDYDDEDYDPDDHIVYYLRSDGLYEDADGNLYANLYNYSRVYLDESASYWAVTDGTVEQVTFEDLDNDTVYYASREDAEKAASGDSTASTAIQSPHYLVAYDSDGDMTRVFYYGDPDETGEVGYYYIVTDTDDDDEPIVSYTGTVSAFDLSKVEVRYNNTANSQELYVCIDARYDSEGHLFGNDCDCTDKTLGYDANGNYVANQWTTVTFYVQTGDEDKSYVLELWSGARNVSGVDSDGNITADGSVEGSFVVFDYSAMTTDEDTYATQLSEYTDKIIDSYIRLLYGAKVLGSDSDVTIASTDENLSYYANLYAEYEDEIKALVEKDSSYETYYKIVNSYTALYYTYSLYDDADYVPFNADTAEDGLVGYDYDIDDYEETLVYFYYSEYAETSATNESTVSVFLDYSATDVTVDSDVVDDEDEDEDEDESELTVWLLVTSIILAVVLIFTLISILARDLWKKARRKRKVGKNVYSSKRKHYIRKLKLTEDPADGFDDEYTGDEATGTEPDGTAPADDNGGEEK